MVRIAAFVFVLLASMLSLAQQVPAQESQQPTLIGVTKPSASPPPAALPAASRDMLVGDGDVVRIEANLITVPARVMDRQGRYVTDLRKDDFEIFEDGLKQDVAFFAPVEKPFTILFVLDVSGSMGYRMEDLSNAANAFVKQLRPDDWLSAVAFADFPWVLFKATKVSELHKEIKLQQRKDQTGTMLYDAVDDALKRMKKVQGRKAIVLFSDGMGSGVFATAKSTLHKAEEQEALIYTVQFNTAPDILSGQYRGGKKQHHASLEVGDSYMKDLANMKELEYMQELAYKTGGRYFQIEHIADLERTFKLVAAELRTQYTLGYYPKKPLQAGDQRQIKVKVCLPNMAVRARDSYFVDKIRNRRQ